MPLTDRCRQPGATLFAVLTAALLLSAGLLGLASLQAAALQSEHAQSLRAAATHLAREIADAMRANRAAAIAGDYDLASCSVLRGTDELATADTQVWCQGIAAALPSGDGAIRVARDGAAIVTVRWARTTDGVTGDDPAAAPQDAEVALPIRL